ncbi:MAG: DNA repair protein, partial [Erysipelotrichaceae bacterium]|nr:DNA repair protein [Erysipelotrichaceae bacterium]
MYMCIDLKSFFASVECVMIGKDPMEYPLVVADASRGQGALCLAVSPALRKFGVKNRCRLFEIPDALYYDIAKPKMKKYIEYSGRIYQVYLRYFAKEDILPYSIDEMFIDISGYQKLYKKEPTQLAKEVIDDIMEDTGITATAGVGTNMFLAKIAMDLIAKKNESHIGYLDEELFREKLWQHRPITDFWQIGKGIARRLEARGLTCLEDVAHYPEKYLYKEFGINARYLIDHAWG